MFVKQYVISKEFCEKLYEGRLDEDQITDQMFCAYNYHKDACQVHMRKKVF